MDFGAKVETLIFTSSLAIQLLESETSKLKIVELLGNTLGFDTVESKTYEPGDQLYIYGLVPWKLKITLSLIQIRL